MKYTEDEIRVLDARVRLKDYLEEKYEIEWAREGTSWKTLCPLHDENTASFKLTEGRGYKCFGCDEGGPDSVKKWMMDREGKTFLETMEALGGGRVELTTEERQAIEEKRARQQAKAKEEAQRKAKRAEMIRAEIRANAFVSDTAIRALARHRGFTIPGLKIAAATGFLSFGFWTGEQKPSAQWRNPKRQAYFVHNPSWTFCQARILGNQPGTSENWPGKGRADTIGGAKAILGSEFLPDALPDDPALFVEGTVDFLSAIGLCHLASPGLRRQIIPLAAVYTGTSLDSIAGMLRGRHVVILADDGKAGEKAADRWDAAIPLSSVSVFPVAKLAQAAGESEVEDLTDLLFHAGPTRTAQIITELYR